MVPSPYLAALLALAALFCAGLAAGQGCDQSQVLEWKQSPDGYAPVTLCQGGSLKFSWTGNHGVARIPTADCPDSWNADGITEVAPPTKGGSYTWTAPAQAGTFHFACQVTDHCTGGQLVTVTVAPAGGGGGRKLLGE